MMPAANRAIDPGGTHRNKSFLPPPKVFNGV